MRGNQGKSSERTTESTQEMVHPQETRLLRHASAVQKRIMENRITTAGQMSAARLYLDKEGSLAEGPRFTTEMGCLDDT